MGFRVGEMRWGLRGLVKHQLFSEIKDFAVDDIVFCPERASFFVDDVAGVDTLVGQRFPVFCQGAQLVLVEDFVEVVIPENV